MKKLVFPLAFACLLGACSLSGGRGDSGCVYRERDLTVNWYSRSYWCVPTSTNSSHRSVAANRQR